MISPKAYNQKTGLALCCPISSHEKGYPFEVQIVSRKVHGVVLADHLKSLDWRAKRVKFIEKANFNVISISLRASSPSSVTSISLERF